MRILDVNNDITIKNIALYLKPEEAKELYDSLGVLIKQDVLKKHEHIVDMSFEHEITITLYDEQQIELLSERSQKIILKDI